VSTDVPDLNLGHGHTLRYVCWRPDRELNPQYDGVPDVERYAAIVEHQTKDGESCTGSITFAGDVQARIEPNRPVWTVESWDPLTVSPSLLCSCGDHGWVRGGRWVRA
jgi:hypothetical protein